jgi:ribonuclease P protein subunit POP4|tara:strand:+ start:617 stop:874 length:258 start_codon:yes stop_codon:yes gene_type:complete
MITSENIKSHEIIGLHTTIIESSNSQLKGLNGIVVYETKNTFMLKTKNGLKTLPKLSNKWEFQINKSKIAVKGLIMRKKPQDRIG